MDMNLKAFMKAELKERGTVEFPGVATFTDEKGNPVPFIIKQLSMKEIKGSETCIKPQKFSETKRTPPARLLRMDRLLFARIMTLREQACISWLTHLFSRNLMILNLWSFIR